MAKRITITEAMFKRIISHKMKEQQEWPMDAELDRNMNTFDDSPVRQAYVSGDDISYIDGFTLRDRLKNDEVGAGINCKKE
jgi:hypothetical protein